MTLALRHSSRSLLRPFLALQLAMLLGALTCLLVGTAARASPNYQPGTFLYFLGDVFFLTVPAVIWMIWRGHGWRQSMELAAAMLTPVVATVVVGEVMQVAYLLWLVTAMYPAMTLGMVVYLLHRRHVFEPAFHVVSRLGPVPTGPVR